VSRSGPGETRSTFDTTYEALFSCFTVVNESAGAHHELPLLRTFRYCVLMGRAHRVVSQFLSGSFPTGAISMYDILTTPKSMSFIPSVVDDSAGATPYRDKSVVYCGSSATACHWVMPTVWCRSIPAGHSQRAPMVCLLSRGAYASMRASMRGESNI